MAKDRPRIFSDIGQKTRHLLYKDHLDPPDVHGLLFDWSHGLSYRLDKYIPGLSTIVSGTILRPKSWKAAIQYSNKYAGFYTGVGSLSRPGIDLTSVVGNSIVAVGSKLSYDVGSRKLKECDIGLSLARGNIVASLTLNRFDVILNASCYYNVSQTTKTVVGAEVCHSLVRNMVTVTLGSQHAVNSFVLVKTRVKSNGNAGAVVKLNWKSMVYLILAGEIDTRRNTRMGFKVGFKPRLSFISHCGR